ncbi:MobV family relaxase [Pseudomonas chlororaphis subsp. aurantiaca]|uniref:MobV family relaxase n=1 Tax=Pseudomonas chlororaphis TaxID=587753 RepID=UPI0027DC285E|nr:MobV family relaxase [Pseudomonas chlororaphis]WMI99760.1 MobV family relaxase [Pseudomonas chlororaphis subsp. aurantiaca]
MYSIIRTKKLKSFGAIARSARHTFREQPTPNADPGMSNRNRVSGAKNTAQLVCAFKKLLPEKRRSDAVLGIEYLITASPEAFKRHGGQLDDMGSGYFRDALAWLRDRHGADNVLCSAVHLDESTPHLVAYVLPLTKEGRLSAREFLGGPKLMRELQDSFHSVCGAPRGLSRGVKGSKAKHDEVASFYQLLAAVGEVPKLTALDYASKAIGRETEAWKHAAAVSRSNVIGATLERRRRKSRNTREKAVEQRELTVSRAELKLRRRTDELNERERRMNESQFDSAALGSRLEVEKARADAMQRIIDRHLSLNEQAMVNSRVAGRALDASLDFVR